MPSYPHIQRYYEDLQKLIAHGGSDNEQNIHPAFERCLDAYCGDRNMKLVPELVYAPHAKPDGTVKDVLRMARGYWEAKDTHDDLDTEIQKKFNRGYPRDNIIFEDSQTAVLYQDSGVVMRVDMRRSGELHRLIRTFLDYELPGIEKLRRARQQFLEDLPDILDNLRQTIDEAEASSATYRDAAAEFLMLCRESIGPDVTNVDVREMLIQHILTKDVFRHVFAEDQFHEENNIARRLESLERTFFIGDIRRNVMNQLSPFFSAVRNAASELTDYAEKQQFLKAIYEEFYRVYNPNAADRLGVVYTPNEIVDFMIRGTDHLLRKHFGRELADDNVQILDPATGTGTFITNLINFLPPDRLEHKYLNEMHANEVAILPYYIANLNIEYTYKEQMGNYLEFRHICFVDTLDNLNWIGASGSTIERQTGLNIGGLSTENWVRVQEQNEEAISVIIGNPPYNANQKNWNNQNKNREYPEMDRRIRDTYVAASSAHKTKQYDMYKRFIRWASDRLDDNGIICFITNSAYLESLHDDGFRRVVPQEFNDIYLIDLGGNFQKTNGKGNVFGITIGVVIGFLVRRSGSSTRCQIHYYSFAEGETKNEKLKRLHNLSLADVDFDEIEPDKKGNWFNQPGEEFDELLPLANKEERSLQAKEYVLFSLHSLGVSTNRDEWVYDFNSTTLEAKAYFFANIFNALPVSRDATIDLTIKGSDTLEARLRQGKKIDYKDTYIVQSLYRPFTVKYYFAEPVMNDRLTRNHFSMFGPGLQYENTVICLNGPGSTSFAVLATDKLTEKKVCSTNNAASFCFPRYRYAKDGIRIDNISQWGVDQFNTHYKKEWGTDFDRIYPSGIGPDEVFAYTYAVLHDPAYQCMYKKELLHQFPRLPFYHDFDHWARMGEQLLDLHVGFETAEPYPLRLEQTGKKTDKPKLRADKVYGVIVLDDATRLTGVPEDAWRYRFGSRSALEWVLDQYRWRKSDDSTINERFDTYQFADHKEHVIDLLRRVCTVSVRTMEIVDSMAYWDGDNLVALGNRDK